MTIADCLSALDGKTMLDADDALAVRRVIYGTDVEVTRAEADALFRLNADAGEVSAEWRALFREAMVDFVVNEQHPACYVDDAKAEWLIASVSHDRPIRDDELDMLIHVLEMAQSTPTKLSGFVLGMVKASVLSGLERRGHLERDDIERLRRVVFAVGGDGNIAVTRHEAETLFDINDALKGKSADPAWTDFFVRAVGDAVLFQTSWTPDAAQETRHEMWLADARPHPLRGLEALLDPGAEKRAVSEGLREIIHWDFVDHALDKDAAAIETDQQQGRRVTAGEAHWLRDRIGRGGALDRNERALMEFLRANGPPSARP